MPLAGHLSQGWAPPVPGTNATKGTMSCVTKQRSANLLPGMVSTCPRDKSCLSYWFFSPRSLCLLGFFLPGWYWFLDSLGIFRDISAVLNRSYEMCILKRKSGFTEFAGFGAFSLFFLGKPQKKKTHDLTDFGGGQWESETGGGQRDLFETPQGSWILVGWGCP